MTTTTLTATTLTATTPTRPTIPAGSHQARLHWLDALRGLAALLVVIHHFHVLDALIPGGVWIRQHLDLGLCGVTTFFLVSGYIIPASLERRGDLRQFWIGRLFRLYPLLIVVIAVAMTMPAAAAPVNQSVYDHTGWNLLATASLTTEFTGARPFLGVTWTLGYEMAFYFVVSALFAVGRHRSSASFALAFAVLALIGGGLMGSQLLTGSGFRDPLVTQLVVLTVTMLVGSGIALILARRPRAGAVLLGATGLVLLLVNARTTFFESALILSTMFAGTVIYRVQHGQLAAWVGGAVAAAVASAGFVVGLLYNHGFVVGATYSPTWQAFSFGYLAAWLAFATAYFARHRAWPAVTRWLGQISYSVYLTHMLIWGAVAWIGANLVTLPRSEAGRCLVTILAVAAVLGVSQLTFRWIERPGQRLGRRVARATA